MSIRTLRHSVTWLGLFLFWFLLARQNHPTPLIDALATFTLLLATAALFYLHDTVLRPRFLARPPKPSWTRYTLSLLTALVLLDLAAVLIIQRMYDALWGPDPARFGFWTNISYEAIFLTVHLIAGILLVSFLRKRRQSP